MISLHSCCPCHAQTITTNIHSRSLCHIFLILLSITTTLTTLSNCGSLGCINRYHSLVFKIIILRSFHLVAALSLPVFPVRTSSIHISAQCVRCCRWCYPLGCRCCCIELGCWQYSWWVQLALACLVNHFHKCFGCHLVGTNDDNEIDSLQSTEYKQVVCRLFMLEVKQYNKYNCLSNKLLWNCALPRFFAYFSWSTGPSPTWYSYLAWAKELVHKLHTS